jgi:thiamine-phosphate pyrophosphorylase
MADETTQQPDGGHAHDAEPAAFDGAQTGRLREALHLIYIVDPVGAQDWRRLDAVLMAGATSVWLRGPQATGAELYRAARDLVWRCHDRGAALIVGDRADVALSVGADAVQLGFRSPPVRKIRTWFPGWIGSSCHNLAELQKAERGGADYAVLSPIFGVPEKGGPLGTSLLGQLQEVSALPLVALGGIEASNVDGVRATGVAGVAAIRALRDAEEPDVAARALSASMTPR